MDHMIFPGFPAQTSEQATADFRRNLEELHETQYGLAKRMENMGDRRPSGTILRGIQRMASGGTRVSGETQAIIGMLIRERERAKYDAAHLTWSTNDHGIVTTNTKGFSIALIPEKKSKWRIEVREEKSGYCHPWPTFPSGLEEAKIKSLTWLEDAFHYLRSSAEFEQSSAARARTA
jgi:hypothetical protein